MPNLETCLDLLKKGVPFWNKWRAAHSEFVPDVCGCDLSPDGGIKAVVIAEGDFHDARLQRANLCYTHLRKVRLDHARCEDARFINANLSGASLRNANLTGADLSRANLWQADLTGADLRGANLVGASLIETDLTGADLDGCSVYATAVWKVNLKDTKQSNLVISPPGEPIITVDNLKMAQFLYMLLDNREVRAVLDSITSKVVLILGRFTPKRKAILDAIRDELRKRDYLPVLFDFEKPANRDITETVSTLAHMARFVIADLSDPKSIPHELAHVAPLLPSVPIMPLIVRPQTEYVMFEHFFGFRHVLKPLHYRGRTHLLSVLNDKVIAPAETLAQRVAGKRSKR